MKNLDILYKCINNYFKKQQSCTPMVQKLTERQLLLKFELAADLPQHHAGTYRNIEGMLGPELRDLKHHIGSIHHLLPHSHDLSPARATWF